MTMPPGADGQDLAGVRLIARGAVRWLVLNEPGRRNPMSPTIMDGLNRACDAVEADPEARAVVLTGAGAAFCAGGDLPYNDAHLQGPAEAQQRFLTDLYKPFLRILDLPMPTIAAVNGPAVGGGLALALLCDLRLAAAEARLVTAFAAMGFAPGMGLHHSLEQAVGLQRAAELLYTGASLTGTQAAEIGLVLRAVPGADLAEAAQALAERIAAQSAVVNRLVKGALFTPHRAALRQRLERDVLAQVLTAVGQDYADRRAAMAAGKEAR